MSCKGCSGAVERALKRVKGVDRVETDLPTQRVSVYGTVTKEAALEAIGKTGKKVLSS